MSLRSEKEFGPRGETSPSYGIGDATGNGGTTLSRISSTDGLFGDRMDLGLGRICGFSLARGVLDVVLPWDLLLGGFVGISSS